MTHPKKTFAERLKSKQFQRLVDAIADRTIWVNCEHCGTALGVDARTGKVDSSFGPVTVGLPKNAIEYRFTKWRGKKGKP